MNTTRRPHGVPGQLNIYVLDKNADYTGFGKHNRLIVFKDIASGEIHVREDDIGLLPSTETQRQKVACKTFQRQHPRGSRLTLRKTEQDPARKAHWYFYQIENVSRIKEAGRASCV